jgi:hypothetical protein
MFVTNLLHVHDSIHSNVSRASIMLKRACVCNITEIDHLQSAIEPSTPTPSKDHMKDQCLPLGDTI